MRRKRLAGEFLFFFAFDFYGACGAALFEGFFVCLEDSELHFGGLVGSGFGGFFGFGETCLDGLKVFYLEFVVYDLHVAHGVDGCVDVGDVVVVEASEHVEDCVGLADVGEEFVAESFTFRGTLTRPHDVDDFDGGGHYGAGVA